MFIIPICIQFPPIYQLNTFADRFKKLTLMGSIDNQSYCEYFEPMSAF